MKLFILGATGGTGRQLVRQALGQGHAVTALARDPTDLSARHQRLSVAKGDILKPETLDEAAAGADAALSALGVASLGPSSVLSEGTQNVIEVLRFCSVERFVCQSAMGVAESKKQLPAMSFFFRNLLYPFALRNVYADKELQERCIRESSLNWTIVRPGELTGGPRTRRCRATGPTETGIRGRVSRADVAGFMLAAIEDESTYRKALSLSY